MTYHSKRLIPQQSVSGHTAMVVYRWAVVIPLAVVVLLVFMPVFVVLRLVSQGLGLVLAGIIRFFEHEEARYQDSKFSVENRLRRF